MQIRKIFFRGLIFIIHQVGLAGQLHGRVEDMEGQPISFATIALLSSDSILLTGTITDDSGNFIVNQPSEASILKALCIGYHTCYYNINGQMNHLLIRMEATVKQMAEVVVKARTPLVERQMDKIVMNEQFICRCEQIRTKIASIGMIVINNNQVYKQQKVKEKR